MGGALEKACNTAAGGKDEPGAVAAEPVVDQVADKIVADAEAKDQVSTVTEKVEETTTQAADVSVDQGGSNAEAPAVDESKKAEEEAAAKATEEEAAKAKEEEEAKRAAEEGAAKKKAEEEAAAKKEAEEKEAKRKAEAAAKKKELEAKKES